jgi:Fur family ferric uptake transcriptional regulator
VYPFFLGLQSSPVSGIIKGTMPRNLEYTRMLTALKAEGYRVTAPRRALLRLLATTREPLSVQEMHVAVNAATPSSASSTAPVAEGDCEEDGEEINLVTVYRTANLLVDLGLARRVEFGQGYYRYEKEESQDGPHHHHLVCQRCGKVEDFHGCDVARLASRLEEESGFKVERHQLELYGTCPTCQTAPAK